MGTHLGIFIWDIIYVVISGSGHEVDLMGENEEIVIEESEENRIPNGLEWFSTASLSEKEPCLDLSSSNKM